MQIKKKKKPYHVQRAYKFAMIMMREMKGMLTLLNFYKNKWNLTLIIFFTIYWKEHKRTSKIHVND